MSPQTGANRPANRTITGILVALIAALCAFADFGIKYANARETIDIHFPVRESEFDTVFSCQNDSNPDCRSCLANQPGNASLVMYSILREALNAGGLNARVRAVPSPNSERSRKMVSEGFAEIKSDWDFNIDADPEVLKSAPILRRGEVEKGIYVSQDTFVLGSDRPVSDVHHMSAVSIRTWRLDWDVLESLAPASLTNAATTQQMYAMINAGRADFTLLEFSNAPGMVRNLQDVPLYPMQGVKVILPAGQHFMISRHLPDAGKIVAALNIGIDALHANGFIHQCLTNSGIINEQVRNWRILNPAEDPVAHQKTVPSN